MSMVCGLDLHRGQITFDTLEEQSGEVWKGRLWKPDRFRLRRWLEDEVGPRAGDGEVKIAVEGCTGWRYVVEEIQAAGFEAHVAEPADTQAMRGRKKHAKTDRTDARLLRDLLHAGDRCSLPPPPPHSRRPPVTRARIAAIAGTGPDPVASTGPATPRQTAPAEHRK